MESKFFIPEVKSVDAEARTIEHIISTSTPDRDGDVVDPKGWVLDEYMENPVVLFGHRQDKVPIGRAIKIEATDDALVAVTQFPPKGVVQLADEVFELNRLGFLKTWSVGFIGDEWSERTDEEGKIAGRNFTKQRLLEYSSVPVPANPEAMNLAVAQGIVSHKTLDKLGWVKSAEIETPAEEPNENFELCAAAERLRLEAELRNVIGEKWRK